MTFMRYTEGYEGAHPRFREDAFTMAELHEYESRRGPNLNLTYVEDWAGFNLTGKNIQEVVARGLIDINQWDKEMLTIWSRCVSEYPDLNFALIGLSIPMQADQPETLPHELSHAFYATDPRYKKKIDKLFNKIPKEKMERILQIIASWSYPPCTHVDEVGAYFATGIEGFEEFDILNEMYDIKKERKPFKKVFKERVQDHFKTRTLIPHLD